MVRLEQAHRNMPETGLLNAPDLVTLAHDGTRCTPRLGNPTPVAPHRVYATGLTLSALIQAKLDAQPHQFAPDLAVAGLAAALHGDSARAARFCNTFPVGPETETPTREGEVTVVGVGDATRLIAGTVADALNAKYVHVNTGTTDVADGFLSGPGPLVVVVATTDEPVTALAQQADPRRTRRVILAALVDTREHLNQDPLPTHRVDLVTLTAGTPDHAPTSLDQPTNTPQPATGKVTAVTRVRGVACPWPGTVPADPSGGFPHGLTRGLAELADRAALRIHTALRTPPGGHVLLVADTGLEHVTLRAGTALADLCTLRDVNVSVCTTIPTPTIGTVTECAARGAGPRFVHALEPGQFHTVVVVTGEEQPVTRFMTPNSLVVLAAATGAHVVVTGLPTLSYATTRSRRTA